MMVSTCDIIPTLASNAIFQSYFWRGIPGVVEVATGYSHRFGAPSSWDITSCSKAEVGYGQHLVKLCVTSSLVNTVLSGRPSRGDGIQRDDENQWIGFVGKI